MSTNLNALFFLLTFYEIPPNKRFFSTAPSFIFIIFCLLFPWFLKFVFFPKHCKYVIVAGESYGTSFSNFIC